MLWVPLGASVITLGEKATFFAIVVSGSLVTKADSDQKNSAKGNKNSGRGLHHDPAKDQKKSAKDQEDTAKDGHESAKDQV
jgi:hypothetical protein